MHATLISAKPELASGNIVTFRFRPEQPVYYSAGQFIEMTLPHKQPDQRGIMRQFTLSSSPSEPELAITVNFAKARSSYKKALRQLQPGATVSIGEPLGDFVLPLNSDIPLIWAAGGVGITPFRSIAKWLADQRETREILLFHSTRHKEEALFAELLRQAGARRQLVETSRQDKLNAGMLLPAINQRPEALIYISGPEAMVETLAHDLQAHGIDHQRIIIDAFLGYNS